MNTHVCRNLWMKRVVCQGKQLGFYKLVLDVLLEERILGGILGFLSFVSSQTFAGSCDGPPDLGAMSWRGSAHCTRNTVGFIPKTYVMGVWRTYGVCLAFSNM